MSSPADLRYTQSHEWVRLEGDIATCGITDHAQQSLGDVVYIDLPEVGDVLEKGSSAGEIESVKAVSDIYAPVSGEVVAVNDALEDAPETVNSAAFGDGWLFQIRVSNPAEVSQMLEPGAYDRMVEESGD